MITKTGTDPQVAGLVYVSALVPDVDESDGEQFAEIQAPPGFVIEPQSDGFGFVNGRCSGPGSPETSMRPTQPSCGSPSPDLHGSLRRPAHPGRLAD